MLSSKLIDLINYPHLNCISFLDEWKEMLGILYHYNVILTKSINSFNISFFHLQFAA